MNKYGTIIAFSGTHSTGKTTSALEFAARWRREHPQGSLSVAVDVERDFLIKPSDTHNGDLQWSIFNWWNTKLWYCRNQISPHATAIFDRTIYDTIAYTMALDDSELADKMLRFAGTAERIFGTGRIYDIIYFHRAADYLLIDDGVRNTNAAFRQRVEDELLALYAFKGIKLTYSLPDTK